MLIIPLILLSFHKISFIPFQKLRYSREASLSIIITKETVIPKSWGHLFYYSTARISVILTLLFLFSPWYIIVEFFLVVALCRLDVQKLLPNSEEYSIQQAFSRTCTGTVAKVLGHFTHVVQFACMYHTPNIITKVACITHATLNIGSKIIGTVYKACCAVLYCPVLSSV